MLVTVPAVGCVPPLTLYVIWVELSTLITSTSEGLPPKSEPVPFVALSELPAVNPVVEDIPVITAVKNPTVPVVPSPTLIEPTVPVVEITCGAPTVIEEVVLAEVISTLAAG
jgi:hypothetical protein